MAAVDRCPHRSTRLSVGWIEPGSIRCAYHGWRYSTAGECVEIPATPDGPLPVGPCLETFEVEVAYDIVWVRLDGSAGTTDPREPGVGRRDDARADGRAVHVADVGAAPGRELRRPRALRLGARRHARPARRARPADSRRSRRVDGELRFHYDPPAMQPEREALYGHSRYRMPMPCTVDIEFHAESGARRRLWMTASPIDERTCRDVLVRLAR